jgi:hypothetical protein
MNVMGIPHSGYSAVEKAVEYLRGGQSPSWLNNGEYKEY